MRRLCLNIDDECIEVMRRLALILKTDNLSYIGRYCIKAVGVESKTATTAKPIGFEVRLHENQK